MIMEILLNMYAKDYLGREKIIEIFENSSSEEKEKILDKLIYFILNAHINEKQLEETLKQTGFKETIDPYKILKSKKNIFRNNIYRLTSLKGKPYLQGFILLLVLFKISYEDKKKKCTGNICNHWWHKDLGDISIMVDILKNEFNKSDDESRRIIIEINKLSNYKLWDKSKI